VVLASKIAGPNPNLYAREEWLLAGKYKIRFRQ
jgi:hypothetical protein